ncbi:uncharacterized protein Tco025E_02523 [Trypanosoma conorhini]|uniref:Uncharacterized protein n=1 Tax=Trypanosoma conorhini TaxID=83891 RepID=A0A422Q3C8_9TRYP|nr:uncharacterized protein Tco025E_02523 [Trypanosoma conorhini]RNF24460.1 hypothetical protein Tco025E_02523 [Trypanosoma conorhini]
MGHPPRHPTPLLGGEEARHSGASAAAEAFAGAASKDTAAKGTVTLRRACTSPQQNVRWKGRARAVRRADVSPVPVVGSLAHGGVSHRHIHTNASIDCIRMASGARAAAVGAALAGPIETVTSRDGASEADSLKIAWFSTNISSVPM